MTNHVAIDFSLAFRPLRKRKTGLPGVNETGPHDA